MGHGASWGAGAVTLGVGALLLGLGVGAGNARSTAWAGDEPAAPAAAPTEETPAQAFARVDAEIKAHLRDKDGGALKADCALVLKEGTTCSEAALRPKYLAQIGAILQGSRDEEVRKAAIKAIGESKEESLFKYLRPHLALPNPKVAGPLLLPAIEATGQLAADDGGLLLVGLVKDAKLMEVCKAAMKALSGYGGNKRLRARIVGDLVSTVRKDRPGIGNRPDAETMQPTARVRTGDDQVSRWEALSPVLVETLNKMTGQNVGTAEDWFDLFDKYKSKPAVLFPAESSEKSSEK